MSTIRIDLEADLVALLRQLSQPVERAARELIVLGLIDEVRFLALRQHNCWSCHVWSLSNIPRVWASPILL
jgi:hypothetical protein